MKAQFHRALCGAVAVGVVWLIAAAGAQAQDLYHIRGTLSDIDGQTLTVDADDGTTKTVTLNDDAGLFIVGPAVIEDIKAGQFVGITSIQVGGKHTAIEVHIFAPELYGLAEGHYPWDLVDEPNMMTNAAVGWIEDVGGGRELRARYTNPDKTDGAQTIVVPSDATIVTLDSAKPQTFIPGRAIWILALNTEDGGIASPAAVIGTADVAPPF